MWEDYIGHESQLYGVEEHRLVGGKGDGMRLFEVKNGLGLAFTVAADRCADIYRLSLFGHNFGYFSPAGHVAPAYYDDADAGFLKSFTAGFLTTCGLETVGTPGQDAGETLPLHGRIGNTPAERIYWDMDEESIWISAHVRQAGIFGRKLVLHRTISCSKRKNEVVITDHIRNVGDSESPLMLLYHLNMGYPLLSENSRLWIPSSAVEARDDHAKRDIDHWAELLPPTPGFREQCYFHNFSGQGAAGLYSPDIAKGLVIRFDPEGLDSFTQWKMMGVKDYVLGLEPGNCTPEGRAAARENGSLKHIHPGQEVTHWVKLELLDGEAAWEQAKEA